MTLPLELGGIHDDNTRRALELIAQQYPLAANNIGLTLLQQLGLNLGTQVGRGKSIIAASENVSSVTYIAAPTPDRVASVVVPTDGLLWVGFTILNASTAGAGTAMVGLFVGSNQVNNEIRAATADVNLGAGPFNQVVDSNSSGGGIGSTPGGAGGTGTPAVAFRTAVPVIVTAGTYNVELRYKISAGTLAVANRNLWVWTMGF